MASVTGRHHRFRMCGRYASFLPAEFIARLFATVNPLPNLAPTWNVAPTIDAPVVRLIHGNRHLDTGLGSVPRERADEGPNPGPLGDYREVRSCAVARIAMASRSHPGASKWQCPDSSARPKYEELCCGLLGNQHIG